jgi:hypothetical protein
MSKPKNIHELLHQGEWWVNKEKEWVKLEDVDLRYARNILNYVETRASRYGAQVAAWLDYTVITRPIDLFLSDTSQDALDRAMEEMWEEAFLARRKCDVWWSSLEFPRALKKHIAKLEEEERLKKLQEAMVKAGGV